ncbi:MAG TPA: hypothetical protein VFR50_09650 [Casimicrobiaceae bacterium]|nr:hypothetical protein [Casimicrobiaceae bacterium]
MALSGATYAATTAGKNSVKTKSIAKGAVTTKKLRNGAVTNAKLRNGAVTGAKIAGATIGSSQLANGAVRSEQLGGGVVTEGKLKNGAVTSSKIANNAVGLSQLGPNSVATAKIQDGAVSSSKLASSLLASLAKNVSYVSKASETNATSPKSVTATCPSGKQVVGGGARPVLGTSTESSLIESTPSLGAEGKRTGWTATVAGSAGTFAVEATAICAEF